MLDRPIRSNVSYKIILRSPLNDVLCDSNVWLWLITARRTRTNVTTYDDRRRRKKIIASGHSLISLPYNLKRSRARATIKKNHLFRHKFVCKIPVGTRTVLFGCCSGCNLVHWSMCSNTVRCFSFVLSPNEWHRVKKAALGRFTVCRSKALIANARRPKSVQRLLEWHFTPQICVKKKLYGDSSNFFSVVCFFFVVIKSSRKKSSILNSSVF